MLLDPNQISKREKLILTGLYLSKFDLLGLAKLGFDSFIEGTNVVGYALGSKPASIKNYRDEFDPLFPNPRQGWHKRPRREYCLKIYEEYHSLDLDTFASLIKSFVGCEDKNWNATDEDQTKLESESAFAKRLITGLAAENYFDSIRHKLPEFQGFAAENTTRLGCGFDFRLSKTEREDFYAVEVKGLTERAGNVLLTRKEYEVADKLTENYFLFGVKNFRDSPTHMIYRNPLSSGLLFTQKKRTVVQEYWQTSISSTPD